MKKIDELDKILKEITGMINNINCELLYDNDISYKIMLNNEYTGVALTVCRTEDYSYYVLAAMDKQMPGIDLGFKKYLDFTNKINNPNVIVLFKDNKEKMIFYEFIFRSVYYFEASKNLRKWHCCDCGEVGIEYFMDDGTISIVDADNNEFILVITDQGDDQRAVFDDHIGKYVVPLCDSCCANQNDPNSDPKIFA